VSVRLLLGACVLMLAPACAHERVRYLDGPDAPAWASASATYCDYCGGGPTATIVVERPSPDGGREMVVVDTDRCIGGLRRSTAWVVHSQRSASGERRVLAQQEVDVDVVACRPEGPIHVRFRTRLAGEPLRFDVRVAEPKFDAGYE